MLVLADYALGADSPVCWAVESPVRGVVNVDVTVGDGSGGAPLHFRIGDWSKPPVDVSIGADGAVQGVQIVLQDEAVMRSVEPSEVRDAPMARVCFEVADWPDARYRDERGEVVLGRGPDGVLIVSVSDGEVGRYWRVGDGLVLGFSGEQLSELRIGPLVATEWEIIEGSAAP